MSITRYPIAGGSPGGAGAVDSVNGQTGTVVLDAGDVGAAATVHTHAVGDITATGTKSSSTFLRGDNTWAAPAATGGSLPPNTVLASAYGVVGDDSTNNLSALNAAIAAVPAAGGTVLLPGGVIRYSGVLNLRSKLGLVGVGDPSSTLTGGTTLRQMSTTANGLAGVDITSLALRDLTVQGPVTGTGIGVALTRSAADATVGLFFERVTVRDFGSHGIELSNPITSVFSLVTARANAGHGWYVHGVPGVGGSAGTSCAFSACYANGNGRTGYLVEQMAYCALTACAADNNGIGYEITGTGTQAINLSGCGAEGSEDKGVAGYTGIAFKVSGGASVVGLMNCWAFSGADRAVWVTGAAYAVSIIGFAENSPAPTVDNSIMVDVGCSATLTDVSAETPMSLSPTTNLLNDGAGGSTFGAALYGATTAYFEGEVATGSTAPPSWDGAFTSSGWVNSQLDLKADAADVTPIVFLTQAAYDALTPDPATLYIVTG